VVRQLFGVTALLLSATEHAAEPLDSIIEEASRSLEQITEYTQRASSRAAQLGYIIGVALGFAGIVVVVGLVLLAVALSGDITTTAERIATAAVAGALGAWVSVMQRLTSKGVRWSYQASAREVVRVAGAVRPILGALFGVCVVVVLESDLLPLGESDNLAFTIGLTFVGGFSERFAQDFVLSSIDPEEKP
jgi:hypothetical protein